MRRAASLVFPHRRPRPAQPPRLVCLMDLDQLRRDTPACADLIHLNNAGASLPPQPVLEAVTAHLHLEARVGGYEAAAAAHDDLERLYDLAAQLVGGHRDEVAFVENATRAWDMVFYAFDWRPGDRVLTCRAEYVANMLAMLHASDRYGVEVVPVPDDAHGQIDLDALEALIDPRVRLIAVNHIPTHGGLIQPAAAIGAIAARHGLPFLLDACQSLGQLDLDVRALGCTMLSGTGRKYLRGPRGTGLLWVRRDWIGRLNPPFIDGRAAAWTHARRYALRDDARRFECWESFVAGRLGLARAIAYALDLGLPAIQARIQRLADDLRGLLGGIDGVTVRDRGLQRAGLVTFTWDGHDLNALRDRLRDAKINVSLTERPSARLDMEDRGLDVMVRASVHAYNTHQELDRFIDALRALDRATRR